MRQFFDTMYQAVELPLPLHLLPASQGKAVEPFVVTPVAEHRLHRGKASAVSSPSFGTVDADFHFVGVGLRFIHLALEERDLAGLGFVRGA